MSHESIINLIEKLNASDKQSTFYVKNFNKLKAQTLDFLLQNDIEIQRIYRENLELLKNFSFI